MGNTPSEFIGSFFLYNILFFLSIIDKNINIKNKLGTLLTYVHISYYHFVTNNNINQNKNECLFHVSLVSIKLINSKMKMVTNECLFMYHLLYQINKFKKIFGDKWMPNHLLYQINKFKKDIWRQNKLFNHCVSRY